MVRTHSRYVIIGAGIHGLSTAWHLARELRARGLGALVAKELLGEQQGLLAPFRFGRYGAGELHPVSHSPFPWS